jgi:hypothetical protein
MITRPSIVPFGQRVVIYLTDWSGPSSHKSLQHHGSRLTPPGLRRADLVVPRVGAILM